MANAATQLADLLSEFQVKANVTPERCRGFDTREDLESWRRHAVVGDLIRSVDYMLQGMDASGENVDMFREALPRWYAGVHFATTPWGSKTNAVRPVCSEADINLLRALGALLRAGKPPQLDENDVHSLQTILTQARDLLEDDLAGMPDDVRRYLFGLICKADMVLRNLLTYGEQTVREVAFELGGALIAEAARTRATKPERASRLWAAAAMLMAGFFGGATGEAGRALSVEALKQLGGG